MKAKKKIITITTRNIEFDIAEITLLSTEEYETNKEIIPHVDVCWWLRAPGYYSDTVACVEYDGSVYYPGDVVDVGCNAVRPVVALRPSEASIPNLTVGDKIEMAGYTWTILRDELALCDDVVGCTEFRKDGNAKDANAYEVSDIKKWLEKWAVENGIEVQK